MSSRNTLSAEDWGLRLCLLLTQHSGFSDVFHQEPLQHNSFKGLENVVLSPYLAAYSRER
jgi:lactate dehydrogenase-like 2-hydroxyacid dehydrogenase